MEEIRRLEAPQAPYDLDEKIFQMVDDEGNKCGEPYSYNEWLGLINSISGVNEDLLGEK